MTRRIALAVAVLSLLASACGAGLDGSTTSGSTTGTTTGTSSTSALSSGSTCPDGSTLTYATFGQAFMSSYCTSCHGGRTAPNLASLAAIQANRATIDAEAAAGPTRTNTRMPEGSSVLLSDRQKLGQWLACGAP